MELYIKSSSATHMEVIDLAHPGYCFRFDDVTLEPAEDGAHLAYTLKVEQVDTSESTLEDLDAHAQEILKELLAQHVDK